MTGRSARRRILLSRDTLLGLIAVLVLAAVCVVLGMWQFGRYEDRRDAAEVIRTNYDASPVALDEVIDDVEAPLPASRLTICTSSLFKSANVRIFFGLPFFT